MAWCTGPAGELAVLVVHERHLRHVDYIKGWVGWTVPAPCPAEVITVIGREVRRTPLEEVPAFSSQLALMADGRFVLASGRTRRVQPVGIWEPNAVLYCRAGTPERQFCIGDDIAALVSDRQDRIWTAHGDEGIFSGHPESGTGLAAWDAQGRSVWTAAKEKPAPALQGCTAATDGDDVWLVWKAGTRGRETYLTRITPSTGETVHYLSPVPEPDGFAVHGARALLTARDHEQPSLTLTRAELLDGTWAATSRHCLTVPGRVVLHCGQGRDAALRYRTGDTWISIPV
ncbi:hypothetical protein [Streptomyces poonensis]|uniref:hypothetical protein n=1 Tax=Streptomyces poonensis TaxID=68255 RepID=UPI001E2CA250|nr:hypothetical protein [Streptomyces poonensis]